MLHTDKARVPVSNGMPALRQVQILAAADALHFLLKAGYPPGHLSLQQSSRQKLLRFLTGTAASRSFEP